MHKILILITFLGFHECASANDYEKLLPYHEGDSVTIEIGLPDQKDVKDAMIPLGEDTRFGLKGHAQALIKGIPPLGNITPQKFQNQLKTPAKAIVKVTKVVRECKPSQYNSFFDNDKKCDPSSHFNDEFLFIEWDKDTKAIIDKLTLQQDRVAAAEIKEKEKIAKTTEALKVRCQPFFDKVIGLRKRIEKRLPEISQQAVADGVSDKSYLQVNKAGNVKVQNDFEKHFHKSTEKEQRELTTLLSNKKYADCPGSAVNGPDYVVDGLEDPRFVELGDKTD